MNQAGENELIAVRALLVETDQVALQLKLAAMHPSDIAEIVSELEPPEQAAIIALLTDETAALVFGEIDYEDQASLLQTIGSGRAAEILDEMPPDDIADLLGEMEPQDAHAYLELVETGEAEDIRELMEYPEDTAGGIMTTEFIALRESMTVAAAIETLRQMAAEAETVYYAYVVNHKQRLLGVLSFRELIMAQPGTVIREIMRTKVISADVGDDQEVVARIAQKYNLLAVPVVDKENRLLGIVTFDDVMDVIEAEAPEDMYRMGSNVAPEENEFSLGVWHRAKKRLPWLVGLLFGELAAGNVIKGFSGIVEAVTVLAFFIPVMAGEAGNAATQSLALVVRGLATGDIEVRDIWTVVTKELRVGVLVGVVCGLTMAALAYFWQRSPAIGLVTGLALTLNIIVAAFLGGFFPVVIKRLGLDPAVASGPFITTLTDVISMFIFFSLATLILRGGL